MKIVAAYMFILMQADRLRYHSVHVRETHTIQFDHCSNFVHTAYELSMQVDPKTMLESG